MKIWMMIKYEQKKFVYWKTIWKGMFMMAKHYFRLFSYPPYHFLLLYRVPAHSFISIFN